jgi:hypothetical protein
MNYYFKSDLERYEKLVYERDHRFSRNGETTIDLFYNPKRITKVF